MKRAHDRAAEVNIIDLASERGRRRISEYESKIRRVVDTNRRALTRLFANGVIFTRQGARAGRDLLLAHQHLLKVLDVLGQLSDLGEPKAPRRAEVEALYEELDGLLERTSHLTNRSGGFLATLPRD